MSLLFSNFKVVTTANTRDNSHLKPQEQTFNFKYKKFNAKDKEGNTIINSAFTLSNKLFASLGLDAKDKGMMEIVSPEGVSYLAIVDNDNAVFYKTTKKNENGVKGKAFKSTLLEAALGQAGIIDLNAINVTQKLDIKLVPDSIGATLGSGDKAPVAIGGVYEISKAADSTLTEAEKAADTVAPTLEPEAEPITGAATPEAEAVPASTATAPEDDDF